MDNNNSKVPIYIIVKANENSKIFNKTSKKQSITRRLGI